MAKPKWLIFMLALESLSATYRAAEKPWTEVKSPHFRVLTDASATSGRRVAFEFEQLRSVFARQFPNFRLDSGAPLVIFAARDEQTAKSLAPYLWKIKGAKPAGYFQHSWEKQYAWILRQIAEPAKSSITNIPK